MDLSAVIAALDAVTLERVGDGRFLRRSDAPAWWRVRVGTEQDVREPLDIAELFPFLQVFMPDAERAWSATISSPVASELWTETDAEGREIHLEAIATRVGTAAVLVISRDDQAFDARQLLLQRARELRLMYDALMQEIERKDILLHTIVHDLTAPLHSIVGSLSLLREVPLPRSARRWTDLAAAAAARQRELIQGILDVFTVEQVGAEYGKPGTLDLRPAVARAVAEREPVARVRQVELVSDVHTCVMVAADSTRLLRVITNLLDNAIRHSPPGTTVHVTCTTEGSSIVLAVEDEGPGVDPVLLPRLFQKLVRDPGSAGHGLGLYFCRITVEQWGGGIGYEPRPGGGARFWIRLPISATEDDEIATGRVAHG
jgi:signal transduction histidine kinase